MKARLRRFSTQRKTWGGLIGRFVLAFGDIENVTYMALYQLPKDTIFGTVSTLGFGKRADLVIELVSHHPEISDAVRSKFISLLKQAKKLSETRNLVAHSPLMLTVYEHPTDGWIHQEFGLANVRNRERAVSLKTLREATAKVEKLAKQLYRSYDKVYAGVIKDHDT